VLAAILSIKTQEIVQSSGREEVEEEEEEEELL